LVTKTWRATLPYDFGFCSQISSSLMRDPCQSGQVLDVNAQCHLVSFCIPIQLEIGWIYPSVEWYRLGELLGSSYGFYCAQMTMDCNGRK
jgi:hypothetical protein